MNEPRSTTISARSQKRNIGIGAGKFTQEQKTTNQTVNDRITAINNMGSKADEFKKGPDKPMAVSVMTGTKPIQQISRRA